MNSRLYVGNVPYTATEPDIRAHFSQCGDVKEVKIITDRESGQPRGFIFVEMATPAEALAAITSLNDVIFAGRPLRISEANERAPRAGGGGGRPAPQQEQRDGSGQRGHREGRGRREDW